MRDAGICASSTVSVPRRSTEGKPGVARHVAVTRPWQIWRHEPSIGAQNSGEANHEA